MRHIHKHLPVVVLCLALSVSLQLHLLHLNTVVFDVLQSQLHTMTSLSST